MHDTCENCAQCDVLGYRPNRKLNTISYWCRVKRCHVTPIPAKDCRHWSYGEPWRQAMEAMQSD